jgi:hypothetical protein
MRQLPDDELADLLSGLTALIERGPDAVPELDDSVRPAPFVQDRPGISVSDLRKRVAADARTKTQEANSLALRGELSSSRAVCAGQGQCLTPSAFSASLGIVPPAVFGTPD